MMFSTVFVSAKEAGSDIDYVNLIVIIELFKLSVYEGAYVTSMIYKIVCYILLVLHVYQQNKFIMQ